MGKKKSIGGVTTTGGSSGNRKKSILKNNIRRLGYKIARWERYKEEGKPAITAKLEEKKVSKKRSPSTKSRHKNWDTTGLKKHKELLESLL